MTKYEAVEIAESVVQKAGFARTGLSNLSEAVYYEFPGRDGQLRVAAHGMRRGFGTVVSLEFQYRNEHQRDDEDIQLSKIEVEEMAADAISEFLERAEETPEDED